MTALADAPKEQVTRFPQPGELWSLWDMLEITSSRFVLAVRNVTGAQKDMYAAGVHASNSMPMDWAEGVVAALNDVETISKELKLKSSCAAAGRALKVLRPALENAQAGEISLDQLKFHEAFNAISQINRGFRDEMGDLSALLLSDDDMKAYAPSAPIFGAEVSRAFPDANYDLSEAGKCFALHRNTAMAFHLMRVLEDAVRALAAAASASTGLALTIYKKDTTDEFLDWGGLISNLKAQVIDKLSDTAQTREFTEIHGLLYSVKEAWRNPTMHPYKKYDDGAARDVFNSVGAFLRGIARLV